MPDKAKKQNNKEIKFPSELRQDLISQNWVIIATGRGKRPHSFKKKTRIDIKMEEKDCPFCNIETQKPPVLIYSRGKKIIPEKGREKIPGDWTTIVIPNKYPALLPYSKLERKKEGKFYHRMNAVGFCEIVITRNHKKYFPHFTLKQVEEVFDAYQQRYLALMKEPFVDYISIFHNHGPEAGASQPHPHSQIITTPLIDVDLKTALANAKSYFQKNRKCIYCELNKWEKKVKKRIVFENKHFLVVCPFASKMAFQVIISPKSHLPYFEKTSSLERKYLAEAFSMAMKSLYKGLSDPAYNFYLHTAPCDGHDHHHYHWHWTILPKTSTMAGFEIGTQMEISTIEPEKAAEYLRRQIKK